MTNPTTAGDARLSRVDYAAELADKIDERLDDEALPAYVSYRLAALLYPQPLVFIDATAKVEGDGRRLTGSLIVFTDQVLAQVTFSGVLDVHFYMAGNSLNHSGSTVDVVMTARRALVSATLPADLNGGEAWQEAAHQHDVFTKHARLVLVYEGADKPVILPLSRRATGDMGPLLEGLARDLAS